MLFRVFVIKNEWLLTGGIGKEEKMVAFEQSGGNFCSIGSIEEIGGFKTQFDVFRFLKRLTDFYRCRAFMVFNLPAVASFDLQSNMVVTNWPPELLSAYDQEDLLLNSPLVRRLRNSTLPFFHDLSDEENIWGDGDDRAKSLAAIFERLRLQRSVHFPTHDVSGLRGCVSIYGDREEFTQREMSDLSYLSIHIFDRLERIRHMDTRLEQTLTEREIDCLSWTAAGKTSVDIADIIGLSEHTVNHYLNRATKKLDTVNRTQAVAKALRIGIIK